MLHKLTEDQYTEPFKKPVSITRVPPGKIIDREAEDAALGSLAFIDHAVLQKGITIKMHEHVNDEILSYVWKGTMYHKDSVGYEVPITPGNLMMMNAGESFWHEEKVKEGEVDMLQIFVRPRETDMEPEIQFHQKPERNDDWYLMVGPENSEAPMFVRNQVYIYDIHLKAGDQVKAPQIKGYQPFLYVMDGSIEVGDQTLQRRQELTDSDEKLPTIYVEKDASLVLFLTDLDTEMSMAGTISGVKSE